MMATKGPAAAGISGGVADSAGDGKTGQAEAELVAVVSGDVTNAGAAPAARARLADDAAGDENAAKAGETAAAKVAKEPQSSSTVTDAAGPGDNLPSVTNVPAASAAELHQQTFVKVVDHPAVGRLQLQGVSWSAERSVAMINDGLLRRGDKVAGCKVIDIRRNRVTLQIDGATFVLRMP